jgi:citrate synthase
MNCTFEEVAYLLLRGELPDPDSLGAFRRALCSVRTPDPELVDLVRRIPAGAAPMDALRSAVSLHSHYGNHRGASIEGALRLVAQMPALLGAWQSVRRGRAPAPIPSEGSHAAYLLEQVTGRPPSPQAERVFDVSLILYAEHEFNASAFAGRVVVSTLSDLHSGIVAAIGALKGPLHGGANEAAWAMLKEIGTEERAEPWVRERLARKERIMGFGHRVVHQGDTRVPLLRDAGRALAEELGETRWLRVADRVESLLAAEKGLKPNVDFPCAWVYHLLGIDVDLYTPVFACARTVGWASHIVEQLADNRLIRPRALYRGSGPRQVQRLAQR